ncbi:MAG: sulfatase [Deltaproteobacteria bacterium]|nr:sulfatase [Deltaproteobacteria bacterium]
MTGDKLLNILLIVIDALRPDHLGCYGYERETSPEIDALAAQGVRFERVVSESSWTKAAVASLLSGTISESHGVKTISDCLSCGDSYLPTILRNVGYVTGCVQTNPFLTTAAGFAQGFDHYIELFDSAPGVYKPRVQEMIPIVSDWIDYFGGSPFFLYLHLLDTHHPYEPSKMYQQFGSDAQSLYDGEIRCVDHHIRLIRDILVQKGVSEKTLYIVTSDHGEEFEDHGGSFHAKHLYEEVLRVPLIISSPEAIPSGLSVPTQVRSIDILPTILNLVGLPPQPGHHGETLCPLFTSSLSSDRLAVSQIGSEQSTTDPTIAVSDGEYKVIWNMRADSQELYHLAGDPGELHNLINHEPTVARTLLAQGKALIEPFRESQHRYRAKPKAADVDADMLMRLRGLGYLE